MIRPFIRVFKIVLFLLCFSSVSGDAYASSDLPGLISRVHAELQDFDQQLPPQKLTNQIWKEGRRPKQLAHRLQESYARAIQYVRAFDDQSLTPDNRIVYENLKRQLEQRARSYRFTASRLYSFEHMNNFATELLWDANPEISSFVFGDPKDFSLFRERIELFSKRVQPHLRDVRALAKRGWSLPCDILPTLVGRWSSAVDRDLDKNPFRKPLEIYLSAHAELSEADRLELRRAYLAEVSRFVIPSFEKLIQFYQLPSPGRNCRSSYGVSELPDGQAWYQAEVARQTDFDQMNPQQIHELGLREVARIHVEIMGLSRHYGSFVRIKDFLSFMKSDPSQKYASAEQMMADFKATQKRVESRLPDFFDVSELAELKIIEGDPTLSTAAYYRDPTDAQPYGKLVLNTHRFDYAYRFRSTTLFIHEGVPGHHLQLGLQYAQSKSSSGTPRARIPYFYANSFVEGWALYAESLGREMGLLDDHDQRFGQLTDELLRAVRLVVDTGIHAQGWSRATALAYMNQNTALSEAEAEIETDRYAVLPGQALGYKLGQLKFEEMRRVSQEMLGDRFDLRRFHAQMLVNGTLGMGLVELEWRKWLAAEKRR